MSKIDYKIKAECLSMPEFNEYIKIRKKLYVLLQDKKANEKLILINDELLQIIIDKVGYSTIKEFDRLYNSFYKRRSRMHKRVEFMLENFNCLFLTFTFDEHFISLKPRCRKQYVKECLLSIITEDMPLYIANIDFGSDNEYIDRKGKKRKGTKREHYHALVTADSVSPSIWKCGQLNFKRVLNNGVSDKKLSCYIAKLTNHAIKESTKRSCVMYCKNFKKFGI